MDKENVAHTRGGIFFSPNKEKKICDPVICQNVGGT